LGKIAHAGVMATTSTELASGNGWCATRVCCTAAAGDRADDEFHRDVCVSFVRRGTFRYTCSAGTAVMVPGSLLLGNAGAGYCCGHDHSGGDVCVSFHYDAAFCDDVLTAVAGASNNGFTLPALPPARTTAVLAAIAVEVDECGASLATDVLAVEIAVRVAALAAGQSAATPKRTDTAARRRAARMAREIAEGERELGDLAAMAADAGLSRFHFLRVFQETVGMAPHQYRLLRRLHDAALQLRSSKLAVSSVAFDCGFGDLSTFNRQFRSTFGVTPTTYRRSRLIRPEVSAA
jgi:AraC-like DNA-binding protein